MSPETPTALPHRAPRRGRLAVALVAAIATVVGLGVHGAVAEGTKAGDAIPSPDRGGSATVFELQLPTGAACTGDTVSGGYLVYSYLVPSTVDPSTLRFGSDGPIAPDGSVQANGVYPLFDTTQSAYTQKNTNVGTGAVPTLPPFQYDPPFTTGEIAPGDYNVGIACAKGSSSASGAANGDRYWNTTISFTADATDAGGYTWQRKGSAANETVTTVTADPPGGATTGQTVTITAAVTGASTAGTLLFRIDGTQTGSTTTDAQGTGSLSTSILGAGSHELKVEFTPTDTGTKGSSGVITYAVTQSTAGSTATATSLAASPAGSAPAGQPVTFTATVAPTDAAGKVRFSDGSTELARADVLGGTSTYRTTLPSGAHSVVATFIPTTTADFGGSSSAPLDYTIGAATAASTSLTLTATAGSGRTVVLRAALLPAAAAGSISFLDSNTTLSSTAATSGSATLTTAALANGTHAFKATFTPTDPGAFSSSISPVVNVSISDSGTSVSSTTTVAGTATTVGGTSTTAGAAVSVLGTSGSAAGATDLSTGSGAAPSSGGLPVTGAAVFPLLLFAALLLTAGWFSVRGARNHRIDLAMVRAAAGRRPRPVRPVDLEPIFGPPVARGAEGRAEP